MNRRNTYRSSREMGGEQDEVNIDMNPMVDLAFLLLTFFMLTTTFNKPKVMEVRMPVKTTEADAEKEQPVKESRAVTLVLGSDDAIYWYRGITEPELNKTTYEEDGIATVMQDLKAGIEDMVVLIKPAPDSNFENLVDILDEMNQSEIPRFAIVDIEQRDLELIETFEASSP